MVEQVNDTICRFKHLKNWSSQYNVEGSEMKKLHKISKKPITFMSSLHFQRNYGSAFFDRKKQVTKSSRRKCRSNLKNFDVKSIDMMNRTLYHGMIVFLQTRGISRSDHENHVASQYSHDCNSHTLITMQKQGQT